MRFFTLSLVLSLSFISLSCQQGADSMNEGNISDLFAEYHEESLRLFPFNATFAGDNRYNDIFRNDISEPYLNEVKSFYTKYKTQLEKFDRSGLSESEQISYDVLAWECDINLAGLEYQMQLLPINQFNSWHLLMGQLASGASAQPFQTAKDYDDWLKRVNGFAEWGETALANMRDGISKGYVLPKALTQKVIPQLRSFTNTSVEDHLYYAPIKNMPEDIASADKERLTTAYRDMVENTVIPMFTKLTNFFENEYLAASRESSGVSAIPEGRKYYDYQIKVFTTTEMTADEIHELGKSEVSRILSEMETVKQQIGFEGDIKDFFTHVRTNPDLSPFTRPEQVIQNFNAIHDKMKANLAKLFGKTPKTQFEVRRTEAFREASASAEYNPGSLDGTRPGIFYVPIPDVNEYNIFTDEDLFLHEAIPGHHYQISLQQEDTSLPEFRKTLYYSAFGEGWALYAESLGKELGLYDDPYQYFGMLSAEMHRAIRLVVDTGMHTKGWTREQAIQYSLDHEAEPEESIIAEIERYMSWPGQALSYKIGQLKIRELRNRAAETLGDKFDIRGFHDTVLTSGNIPLAVLENRINKWIEEQSN